MAKDPALLFYPDAFLGGVKYMSYEDRGKYITLLCDQFVSGHIPENHMISVCESTESPVIKKFCIDEDGLYYNERMELEKEKRANYCKTRSNKKSGRKKKNHMISVCESYGNHPINVNRNINKDINCNRCLTEYLIKRISEKRQIKTNESKIKSWNNTFKIMRKSDKREVKDIYEMIKECHDMTPNKNGFTWANNILSPEKLRKQWNEGKIYIGMNNKLRGSYEGFYNE